MISLDVQAAVRSLQQPIDVTKTSLDSFELDRTDRALDELIRNPAKTGSPIGLARSARANALKVVRSRAATTEFSLDEDLHAEKRTRAESAAAYDPMVEFETLDWLASTPSVTTGQRRLLTALADGCDADDIARAMGAPVQRMRERISRARTAAYAGYQAEVVSA